jgi:RHS repeat-associated protein
LADPNWNVIALVDASGTVVERMKYDAFGKVTWLDATFTAKTNSDYAWNRTFTGQVLDSETGLMLYRMRYYHTGVGRFVSRDPIGYLAGDANIFRLLSNNPLTTTDVWGLQKCCKTEYIPISKPFWDTIKIQVAVFSYRILPSHMSGAYGPTKVWSDGIRQIDIYRECRCLFRETQICRENCYDSDGNIISSKDEKKYGKTTITYGTVEKFASLMSNGSGISGIQCNCRDPFNKPSNLCR